MPGPIEALDRRDSLLTAGEVAGLLNISVRAVRHLGASGRLPAVRISERTVRYSPEAVRALLATGERPAT